MNERTRTPAQGGRRNKTGFRGIYQIPSGKFKATIHVDKEPKYLGLFDTIDMARDAYARAEIQFFGRPAE